MTARTAIEQRLADSRRAFDESFASAPAPRVDSVVDLLAVRVAGDPYAIRMREITGLVASRKIVPAPSRRPELLGLAGNRGSVVAVYGLAALLGYGVGSRPTRWLALAGGAEPVALAFEQFEGFWRARPADLRAARPEDGATPHAGGVVLAGDESRRVIDVASMLATLKIHAGAAGPPWES